MRGEPIEKCKETMALCVHQMNPGDTFQMLAFSNEVMPLFDKPQPNTTENRALAQAFLGNRLGSGGTQMLKAIEAALTPAPDPQRLRIVCFMTDGYVGNDFEILDSVKKNIGAARIFPFGTGTSVNRFLLDGMAEMGRGVVDYVTLQEQGAKAAQRFYQRISKPVLTDITIDWGELPVGDVYPRIIPDLFSAKPVIIKGRYSRAMKGVVTIRGKLGGKPWEEQVEVDLPAQEGENQALPPLWARAKIAELTQRDYMGIQQGKPDPTAKEEVTKVALDYRLMSQFTSFVAVEEKIVTEGGVPKKVAVPVEMPEGVSYEGVFGDRLDGKPDGSLGKGAAMMAPPTPAGSATGPALRVQYRASNAPVASKPAARPPAGALGRRTQAAEMREAKALPKTRAEILKQKLDPLLIELGKKLDKSGDYVVPGKVAVKSGKVKVLLVLSDMSPASLAKLKQHGFVVKTSTKSAKMVIGTAPVTRLETIALLEFVERIAPVGE